MMRNSELTYTEFKMQENVEIVLAGVQNNPYFDSTSGFVGSIAMVELALIYTQNLEFLWTGFLKKEA